MTIPYLMNCPHTTAGWCSFCVAELGRSAEKDRKDAERYRRLAVLVKAGEWGCFSSEIVDSYGKTDDTYMDDKKHMDAVLDSEPVVTSADEWARCFKRATEPLLVAPPVTKGKATSHTDHSGIWNRECPACVINAKLNQCVDDYDLTSNDTRRGD